LHAIQSGGKRVAGARHARGPVVVTGIGSASHLQLPDCSVENTACVKHIDVVDGRLVEHGGAGVRSSHGASRADLIHERAQP